MSDHERKQATAATPRTRRRRSRPRRSKRPPSESARTPAPPPASASTSDDFKGMTISECCADCTADRCVISGVAVCAHPGKAGLQASLMQEVGALTRFAAAKQVLAHQRIDTKARRP